MGLDMYLNKKTFIGNQYRKPETMVQVIIPESQEGVIFPTKPGSIKVERISEIIENVGYWRKANQIHKWFVDNVQDGEDDCKEYYVSFEQLNKLLVICQEIKKVVKVKKGKVINADTCEKTLPSASGFFFGGTEYDEYYIHDIDNTIKMLSELLAESSESDSFYYQSSW